MCHHRPFLSNGLRRTCARCSGERSARKYDGSSAPIARHRLRNHRRGSRPRGTHRRANLLFPRKDEQCTAVCSWLSRTMVARASTPPSCATKIVCVGGLVDLHNIAGNAGHSFLQSRYCLCTIMATGHVVRIRSFSITDNIFTSDLQQRRRLCLCNAKARPSASARPFCFMCSARMQDGRKAGFSLTNPSHIPGQKSKLARLDFIHLQHGSLRSVACQGRTFRFMAKDTLRQNLLQYTCI
jgi:hypothetical protein